jgi:hypothetical protein
MEHIKQRMVPSPQVDKDYITHSLHWQRTGMVIAQLCVLIYLSFALRLQR